RLHGELRAVRPTPRHPPDRLVPPPSRRGRGPCDDATLERAPRHRGDEAVMSEMLALEFMRNALIGAVLVGFAAPVVGVAPVKRRRSLLGDGMGPAARAGGAVGGLPGTQPVLTALIAAVLAAVAIELLRQRGGTSGDIALAVMFYGGI